jgi:hypothetical protein
MVMRPVLCPDRKQNLLLDLKMVPAVVLPELEELGGSLRHRPSPA